MVTKVHLTYRQSRALEIWISNGRKSKAKALRAAGYGRSVIRQPHKVFESIAVLHELQARGLDPSGIPVKTKPINFAFSDPAHKPKVDFSYLTKEDLQNLKEKLASVPEIEEPEEEHKLIVLNTNQLKESGIGVYSTNRADRERNSDDMSSLSSM